MERFFGIVAAITAFLFTENIAISISLFAGLRVQSGMSVEQKMQVELIQKCLSFNLKAYGAGVENQGLASSQHPWQTMIMELVWRACQK